MNISIQENALKNVLFQNVGHFVQALVSWVCFGTMIQMSHNYLQYVLWVG